MFFWVRPFVDMKRGGGREKGKGNTLKASRREKKTQKKSSTEKLSWGEKKGGRISPLR